MSYFSELDILRQETAGDPGARMGAAWEITREWWPGISGTARAYRAARLVEMMDDAESACGRCQRDLSDYIPGTTHCDDCSDALG